MFFESWSITLQLCLLKSNPLRPQYSLHLLVTQIFATLCFKVLYFTFIGMVLQSSTGGRWRCHWLVQVYIEISASCRISVTRAKVRMHVKCFFLFISSLQPYYIAKIASCFTFCIYLAPDWWFDGINSKLVDDMIYFKLKLYCNSLFRPSPCRPLGSLVPWLTGSGNYVWLVGTNSVMYSVCDHMSA